MLTIKISELPLASQPYSGSEYIVGIQSGTSVRIPYGIFNNINGSNILLNPTAYGSSYVSGIKFRNDGYAHYSIGGKGSNFVISNTSGDNNTIWGTASDLLTITSTGNVGIGTSSPTYKLDVAGNIAAGSLITRVSNSDVGATSAAQSYLVTGGGVSLTLFAYGTSAGYIGTTSNHPLIYQTNSTERMRIDAVGNVGIGTTSPLCNLAIGSGSLSDTNLPIQINAASGFGTYFGFNKGGAYGGLIGYDNGTSLGSGLHIRNVTATDPIIFFTNNTVEQLRIISTGNVGIGTSNPLVKLSINSTDAIKIPLGTSTQRPTGSTGYIRYNTTTNVPECYTGANWQNMSNEGITAMTKFGGNAFSIIKGGKLFTCHGSSTVFNYYLSGRGGDGNDPFYGVDTGLKHVAIPSFSPIKQLIRGSDGAMGVLLQDGSLYLWGQNLHGQCGIGTTAVVLFPTLVLSGVSKVWDVVCGGDYTGALAASIWVQKTDGTIWSCGYNIDGNLGLGSTVQQLTWVQITALGTNQIVNIFPIGNNGAMTFVEKVDGTIWACGDNTNGALGDGTTVQKTSFVDVTTNWGGNVSTTGSIIKVMSQGNYSNGTTGYYLPCTIMLRKTSGGVTSVRTCGYNESGQIGNGTVVAITTPYLIPSSTSVADIAILGGRYNSMQMLNNDGTLYAWGRNILGQLGDGTIVNKTSPTLVQSNVTKIFSDQYCFSRTNADRTISFIKKTDGLIYATGYDDATGYTGTGASASISSYTWVRFPYGINIIDIGWYATTNAGPAFIALSDANMLYVWGYNGYNGVTGNNTVSPMIPTNVTTLPQSG